MIQRTINITIPGEPKPQSRPRSRAVQKAGKWIAMTYQPKGPDMDYRTRIAQMAASEMVGRQLFDGPLAMWVLLAVTKPKSKPKYKRCPDVKPDIDNYIKAICDALEGIVFRNDSQICQLIVKKLYAVFGAETQIYIKQMQEHKVVRGKRP